MSNLAISYKKSIVPNLRRELNLKNDLAVPRIVKAVVNIGVGKLAKDDKALGQITHDLALITGQKPVATKAKKAIASFKTRAGMIVGFKVTLRGRRMYDFLERLIKVALPRTRDFRGLDPKSVDEGGNLTIGIKEHIVFPEVTAEHARNIFGFEVTVVSTAKDKGQAVALFKALGFPFKKQ